MDHCSHSLHIHWSLCFIQCPVLTCPLRLTNISLHTHCVIKKPVTVISRSFCTSICRLESLHTLPVQFTNQSTRVCPTLHTTALPTSSAQRLHYVPSIKSVSFIASHAYFQNSSHLKYPPSTYANPILSSNLNASRKLPKS